MALEITTAVAAGTAGLWPRINVNLITSNLNLWTDTVSGGGLPIVFNGGLDNQATYETVATSGRSMSGKTFTVVAGTWYALVVNIASITGAAITDENILIANSTATLDQSYPAGLKFIAATAGEYALVFHAATSGTTTVRVGLGCDASQQAGTVMVVNQVAIYELTSATAAIPEYAYSFNLLGGACAQALNNNSTHNTTTGAITRLSDTLPVVTSQYRKLSVGVFVGDSYSNDDTDWPKKLVAADGNLVMLGRGVAGEHLGQFDTAFADTIALDGYTLAGVQPEFVVIQGSINSINSGSQTVAQAIASELSMINKALAAGIVPICTNIVANTVLGTASERRAVAEFNLRLFALCAAKGAVYVDVNSALNNASLPNTTPYDSDGTHLTSDGYTLYATTILHALNILRSGSSVGSSGRFSSRF